MKKTLKTIFQAIVTVFTIILVLIDRLLLFPVIWKSSPSIKEYSEFSHLLYALFNRWVIIASVSAIAFVLWLIIHYFMMM